MTDVVTIISSAAYANTELVAEFGKLPPAFLPLGHKRLYELQLTAIKDLPGRRVLSIPESFEMPPLDAEFLGRASVEVVTVPDGMSLGQSILYVLQIAGQPGGEVRLLHGDTLIYDLPGDVRDIVAVGQADASGYAWGIFDASAATFRTEMEDEGDNGNNTIAGYFSFSDETELRRSLARSRGDFIHALDLYRRAIGLSLLEVSDWLDFGHLQTFYHSRCAIRTTRSFNELKISFRVVEKTSIQKDKVAAEAHWFQSIPPELRLFSPNFLGLDEEDGQISYKIEYIPTPTLHELFVFSQLNPRSWDPILNSSFTFLETCRAIPAPSTLGLPILELTSGKTSARLQGLMPEAGIDIDRTWRYAGKTVPSLREMAAMTANSIDAETRNYLGVMHGDFCFTNIFFDWRIGQIRTIDPRGYLPASGSGIYGDVRYDIAKFAHSLVGRYDFILTNRFYCSGFDSGDVEIVFPTDASIDTLISNAAERKISGRGILDPEIVAMTIHLFLSMLPLHSDRPDRQKAFVVNALRLFVDVWEGAA